MARSEERSAEHPVVLCVQDTTELDFNGREAEGLGRLSHDAQRGMYVHPTLLVTPERTPLGVVDLWMWARGESKEADRSNPPAPESARWIEGYERIAEMAVRVPQTRFVYVADREGDIGALMHRATMLGTPADWLLRAMHDRKVAGEDAKLWSGFSDEHLVGKIVFDLPRGRGRPGRKVHQHVFVRRVRLHTAQGGVEAAALLAREQNPPKGAEPVTWRLLSSCAVATLEDAGRLIDWYRARWEIEMFFNILKQGCKVEELQLSALRRIENALALYVVIAWRVLSLLHLGRTCPNMSCEAFFEPQEWRAAYIVARKKPPDKPPMLNEVIHMVAIFGGFIGRKGDGSPGAKVLWEGLQRLNDFTFAIEAVNETKICG